MAELHQITKILAGLLLVIGVMFLMAYFFKNFKGNKYLNNKCISIISSVFLGNKEKLVLVEVEGKKTLIGVTANSIQTLLLVDGFADNVEKKDSAQVIPVENKFHKVLKQQQEEKCNV